MEKKLTAAGVDAAPAPAESPHDVALWPAALLLLALAGVSLLVSERSAVGPRWLVPAALVVLVIPLGLAHSAGAHRLARGIGMAATAIVTAATVSSAVLLVVGLQNERRTADRLLADAALIWIANVLTFALWYWEVDGGGPASRPFVATADADFLFPQMAPETFGDRRWAPRLVDYLFLAFTASTAFSPTDTMPLTGRAKLMMMAQALVSLIALAVIASRAINML